MPGNYMVYRLDGTVKTFVAGPFPDQSSAETMAKAHCAGDYTLGAAYRVHEDVPGIQTSKKSEWVQKSANAATVSRGLTSGV